METIETTPLPSFSYTPYIDLVETNITLTLCVGGFCAFLLLVFFCICCQSELRAAPNQAGDGIIPEGVFCYCQNCECQRCDTQEYEDWLGCISMQECCIQCFNSGFSTECCEEFENCICSCYHCSMCCICDNYRPPNSTPRILNITTKLARRAELPPGVIPRVKYEFGELTI